MKSTQPCCPVCRGETIEIRAKLICRACGMILETCCEGGPMGSGGGHCGGSGDRAADAPEDAAGDGRRDGTRDASR